MAHVIKNLRFLESLILNKCNLGDSGVAEMAQAINYLGWKSMKRLELSQNNIDQRGGLAIGELITNNTSIEELNLSWNRYGS